MNINHNSTSEKSFVMTSSLQAILAFPSPGHSLIIVSPP